MKFSVKNIEYQILFGSDIIRDGVYLELSLPNTNPLEQLAEVFFHDPTGKIEFHCWSESIPFEAIKTLVEKADVKFRGRKPSNE